MLVLFVLVACRDAGPRQTLNASQLSFAPGAFPHQLFSTVLAQVVSGEGRVDYKTLKKHRGTLEQYLAVVAQVSPHSHPQRFPQKADRLAYWLNAYNAYVLYAVTERPKMRSVSDENIRFFYLSRYWFGGESWSLHAVENDVVRKEFVEPRIHFALNCASVGCPELPAEAFVAQSLEAQLDAEANAFCTDPDKVRLRGVVLEASQIFEWYSSDFAAAGGPIGYCQRYRHDLKGAKEVRFIPYDWSLNAQPGRALFD